MTWDQSPQLLLSALSAAAVITGVIVTIRGVIKANAEGGGALRQQVESLEKRVGSMEGDVRDLRKGQTDMLVALAKIPAQLPRNLRTSVEGLARRAGMLGPGDA